MAKEVEEDPQLVLQAPHLTRTPRVDEVLPVDLVRWKPAISTANG
ncbi:MAG: hypothetical protein WKF37_15440 [Bryobacteraceae bacterium]